MNTTPFSRRLSYLMKERKISGKKIGDAIGKTQKTISRYANAEVDPDTATKNKILKAISEISGISDDGKTIEDLERESLLNDSNYIIDDSLSLGTEYTDEICENTNSLETIYNQLSLSARTYYFKYIKQLHLVTDCEHEIVAIYKSLEPQKRQKLLATLEKYDFNFSNLKGTDKMSSYLQMIKASEKRPVIIKKEQNEIANTSDLDQKWSDAINMMMYENDGSFYFPDKPYFLSYDPEDWYFLLRLHIFELNDDGNYLWIHDEIAFYIGSNLLSILNAIESDIF